jgi:hypothetical protein
MEGEEDNINQNYIIVCLGCNLFVPKIFLAFPSFWHLNYHVILKLNEILTLN